MSCSPAAAFLVKISSLSLGAVQNLCEVWICSCDGFTADQVGETGRRPELPQRSSCLPGSAVAWGTVSRFDSILIQNTKVENGSHLYPFLTLNLKVVFTSHYGIFLCDLTTGTCSLNFSSKLKVFKGMAYIRQSSRHQMWYFVYCDNIVLLILKLIKT